jgi:hypothetical protein
VQMWGPELLPNPAQLIRSGQDAGSVGRAARGYPRADRRVRIHSHHP